MTKQKELTLKETDRIVEMAWEDRTPFDAIFRQFGVAEKDVIKLMRNQIRPSSFKMWRKRVQGRKNKHLQLREESVTTFKSGRQKAISLNKFA
jgi:uncharacterized protein (TIGR03643 family)